MPRIKGRVDGPVFINTENKTWIVEKNATIESATGGILEDIAEGNTYIIHGMIKAGFNAIATDSLEATIRIGETGRLTARIEADSANLVVENAGKIRSANEGILSRGDDAAITNSGLITGVIGIEAGATSNLLIVNEKAGVIKGHTAITLDTFDQTHARIVNRGLIQATDDALYMNNISDDVLVNRGRIEGDLYFNGGDDRIDIAGGTVIGEIQGGAGDDLLVTDTKKHVLIELAADGQDTVASSATYELAVNVEHLILRGARDIDGFGNDDANTLLGNDGDNLLRAKGGNDRIDGDRGNDKLHGGNGRDVFVFGTGYGRDVILDFDPAADLDSFDFDNWKTIEDFDDLIDNHMFRDDGDTVFRAGKDSLRLKDWEGPIPEPFWEI